MAGPESSAAPSNLPPPDTSTRAYLRLAWPLYIANLAMVGSGTIDTLMAGRLSPSDLAGVAVGSSIYVTIYIGLMGVLQGLSAIVGHHFGAQRWRAIGDDLHQALWLSVFLAIIGVPCVLATDLWVSFSKVDAEVASITANYMTAAAFGLPAALAVRAFIALNAAVTRPKVTMIVNLGALALKAPLNTVFMYGIGPIPAMGGAGAGVATAVNAVLMLTATYAVWRFDPYYLRFRSRTWELPRWARQRELLKLGIPIGLSSLFEVASFTFMAVLIARLGAVAVAGHQIVANLVALLFMVPLSLGIAASVLVAQSLGAIHPRVARRAALRGFRLALGIAVVFAVLLWTLRNPIVSLYTSDAAVAAIATSLIGFAAIFHIFDAAQGVALFALRGYKYTFWPMVVSGVALWAIGLGGGYMIGLTDSVFGVARGPRGFWEAATLGLGLAAVALCWLADRISKDRVRSA